MKKFLSFVACFMLVTCFAFVGCGKNDSNRIHLQPHWPNKFYVEYDQYDGNEQIIDTQKVAYAKDGNDHYVHYQNITYGYAYRDVYVRHEQNGYKSAIWTQSTGWVISNETQNRQNEEYYRIPAQGSDYLSKDYIDIDLYGEKLENETITVGSNSVECVVYKIASENKTYWFEANSTILIQYKENNKLKMKANVFDTTLTMAQVLTSRGINTQPIFG